MVREGLITVIGPIPDYGLLTLFTFAYVGTAEGLITVIDPVPMTV